MHRILIVQPHKLGDLLLTTPMASALKAEIPGVEIDAWTTAVAAPALANNPDFREVSIRWKKPSNAEIFSVVKAYRAGQYDAVLFPHGNNGNYIIASFLARIPNRVGWARRWYKKLMTAHTEQLGTIHMVERFLINAELLLDKPMPRMPLKFVVTEQDHAEADKVRGEIGLGDAPFICVHPGCGGSAHQWGPENYGEYARMLHDQTGLQIVVTGSAAELEQVERVRRAAGCRTYSLAGKTSFPSLAAFVQSATCFVAGSTGTMHLAASQGIPGVFVEPTAPAEVLSARWRPWMVPHRLVLATKVCAGCHENCDHAHFECVASISPARVLAATLDLLEEVSRSPSRPGSS